MLQRKRTYPTQAKSMNRKKPVFISYSKHPSNLAAGNPDPRTLIGPEICRPIRRSMKMESELRDWSSLPPELLELIANNIAGIFDYFHFRSVCTSWRLAAAPEARQPQLPWLVISPATNPLLYTLHLPEAQGKKIYGSAHRWLLMVSHPSPRTARTVSLLNPVTRAHVHLPPLPKIFNVSDPLEKAILCSHPISARPRQLLVAFVCNWNLALFRQGDSGWIFNQLCNIHDILYLDDKIYCVDASGRLAVVQIDMLTWLTNPPLGLTWLVQHQYGHHLWCRIVDAAGSLLLLRWFSKERLWISLLDGSGNKDFSWVHIDVVSMIPFSKLHTVRARRLPDSRGYRIYVSFESLDDTASSCLMQEIDVVPDVGVTKQSCLQVPEGSWSPSRHNLTWMVTSLH